MRSVYHGLAIAALAATLPWSALAATSAHSIFRKYPGFRIPGAKVEMIHDKGVTLELIVNCGRGRYGILIVSKAERLICGPDHRCVPHLDRAVQRLCR